MTKIYLAISAVVVFVIGISVMIFIRLKVRKMRKNLYQKQEVETFEELSKLRSDLGTLPYALKDFFKSKSDDFDTESFINTVYKNGYKKVLCSYNDNFVLAALQEKCKMPIYFDHETFDIEKWNLANDKLKHEINYTPVLYENNSQLDLVIYNGKQLTNYEIYKKYYSFLNENGMIIINQNHQSIYDLKLIINSLKTENIVYEVSYVKSKFLYIVKRKKENIEKR